jgi:hypothetical protein
VENKIKRLLYKIIKKFYQITGKWKIFNFLGCFVFQEKCINVPDKLSYVSGYFQCEKYFLHIRDILVSELQAKKTIEYSDLFNNPNIETVSVHVRRGDYIGREWFLGTDYYKRAFMYIESKLHNVVYYIFSEDLSYCEENLDLKNRKYRLMNVDRKYADYEELCMMTKCRHHIIANSTFSWWGAWLCTNPEQLVIAPKTWLEKDCLRDIIPSRWIQV